jgi:hypothetical protein
MKIFLIGAVIMKITLSIDSGNSLEIGHADLEIILMCLGDTKRHAKFFAPLFDHPSSEVRSQIAAMSFLPLDELECLSRDASIEVVRQVARNNRALKYFDDQKILNMISRDVSVATEIADNLDQIRESAREEVIDSLFQHTDPKVVETVQRFVDARNIGDDDFDLEDDEENSLVDDQD